MDDQQQLYLKSVRQAGRQSVVVHKAVGGMYVVHVAMAIMKVKRMAQAIVALASYRQCPQIGHDMARETWVMTAMT